MRIKIEKPHPDYPFAYVHVDLGTDIDGKNFGDVLVNHGLTLLGRWTIYTKDDRSEFRAPVLLEDEHVKPKKTKRR